MLKTQRRSLPSAVGGGVAFRFRSSRLSTFNFTSPARQPLTEADSAINLSVIKQTLRRQFTAMAYTAGTPSGSHSAMRRRAIICRRRKRQRYYGSLKQDSRFRSSVDFSAAAKASPLSLHRAHLSLRVQRTNKRTL